MDSDTSSGIPLSGEIDVTEQAGIVEPATLTSLDFRRRFSRLFQKVNDSCSITKMTAPSLARTLYHKTTTTGRRRHRREQQHPSPEKVLVTFVLAVCGIGWVRRIQLPSSANGISTPVASRVETEKSASSNLVMIETGTTTRHNVSYTGDSIMTLLANERILVLA
jgi:hypothetical protein